VISPSSARVETGTNGRTVDPRYDRRLTLSQLRDDVVECRGTATELRRSGALILLERRNVSAGREHAVGTAEDETSNVVVLVAVGCQPHQLRNQRIVERVHRTFALYRDLGDPIVMLNVEVCEVSHRRTRSNTLERLINFPSGETNRCDSPVRQCGYRPLVIGPNSPSVTVRASSSLFSIVSSCPNAFSRTRCLPRSQSVSRCLSTGCLNRQRWLRCDRFDGLGDAVVKSSS